VVSEEDAPAVEQRSFFGRIRDRFSVSSQKASTSPSGLPGVLIKLLGSRETASIKRDTPAFLRAFNELPWLRATVTHSADAIAANEWEILSVTEQTDQRTGETEIVTEEPTGLLPIHSFLNNPNPQLSFSQLLWLTTIYLELVGEAYWWMVDVGGEPQAYPIPPDKVVRTPTFEDPLWHISGPQGEYTANTDELIAFMHPDPVDPYARGVGLAQSLSHDLDTDDAASRYVLSYFNNSARPPLLIYGEGLNAERMRQLEDDWNQEHGGFWNAGKARFLSRKVEIKELSQKFEGADIVALRQHQRDVVASVMGVPPEIMGILTASNRATIDAADLFFTRYTLRPRLDFLQEVLNKQLVPRFDDTGTIIMKYINPVQKDKETILKAARFMPSALMIDDWRELMEFDPLPDEDGQCFLVPLNMQVLGRLKSQPPIAPTSQPQPPGTTATPPPEQAGYEAYGPLALKDSDIGETETPFGTLRGRKVKKFKELVK